jgi:hypothetical protein
LVGGIIHGHFNHAFGLRIASRHGIWVNLVWDETGANNIAARSASADSGSTCNTGTASTRPKIAA